MQRNVEDAHDRASAAKWEAWTAQTEAVLVREATETAEPHRVVAEFLGKAIDVNPGGSCGEVRKHPRAARPSA